MKSTTIKVLKIFCPLGLYLHNKIFNQQRFLESAFTTYHLSESLLAKLVLQKPIKSHDKGETHGFARV